MKYKLFESLDNNNKINNAAGLVTLKNKINGSTSSFVIIKVLHIGDSHVKSGYFAEPVIDKLNAFFVQSLKKNIFFNGQVFSKVGTKYSDYAELSELDIQLVKDKPDLVIISLGTNDVFSGSAKIRFYEKIDHLVSKVNRLSPGSVLLLTTPGDALLKNQQKNIFEPIPLHQYVVSEIIKYANDHQLAYWNLYQLMGGANSINTWVINKNAEPDRIHFTPKGYKLIAGWLFEALRNCL